MSNKHKCPLGRTVTMNTINDIATAIKHFKNSLPKIVDNILNIIISYIATLMG